MIINTNLASVNTLRQMGINEKSTQSSLAKLSSGLRINSAADDAAGLSISEKMRGQISGLNKATSNAQDGISLVSTAEGSLNETSSILQRMRELAVQAGNDTNTTVDRGAMQTEMNQLTSEINRIGNTTQFNTQNLLKGTNAAAVTTAQTTNTDAAGKAGVAVGATSALAISTNSVAAVASTTTVQGNTSAATGTVGNFAVTTTSVQGAEATAYLKNGLTFSSKATGTTMNGGSVSIVTGAAGSPATYTVDSNNNYVFTIKSDANITSQGELYNTLQAATNTVGSTPFSADAELQLAVPTDTGATVDMSTVTDSQSLAGGVDEEQGVAQFDITDAFDEVDDTITIAGKTFTAKGSGADATKGEFDITGDATAQATSLKAALNSVLASSYTATGSGSNIILTQASGTAKGVDLTAPVTAGSGTDDKLSITNAGGQNLKTVSIAASVQSTGADGIVAATGNTFDTSLQVTAGDVGDELNGVIIDFSGLAADSGAAAVLTTSWDATTKTLSIGGSFNGGDAAADATALRDALRIGLGTGVGNANFASAATLTVTAGATMQHDVLVAGAASVTFGSGVGSVTGQAGLKAGTGAVDSFKAVSGNTGTSLNGVTVAFGTIEDGTNNLNSSWDAKSQTLTISGTIDDGDANTAKSTTMLDAIQSGLTSAGFDVGTMSKGAEVTTGNHDDWTGSITFGVGAGSVAGTTGITNDDTMVVDQNNGELSIHLATATGSNNSAAKIQAAVRALGTVSTSNGDIDFSKYTFEGQGSWDTKTVGENFTKDVGTMVGGTTGVKGVADFSITTPLAAGDLVTIKGETFTGVNGNADISKGQFDISGGTAASQAASLRSAINANTALGAAYTAGGSGGEVVLTENTATGTDLKVTDQKVTGTGTQGQYSVDISDLLTNGASFELDGEKITASNKIANVGYDNGTAIKVAESVADQTKALADAINTNATLKAKYTASVDETSGSLVLTQTAAGASATAPQVSTVSSTVGDFTATLQIGANAGQTMTIEVADMRSLSLGISGDGSTSTVAAKDGHVASYVATASVSNGTDNTNIEFGLDISTADKATAAISVIDDATAAVSAERSNLGALQNRLEHTVNNLGTSSQNITTAEANIRDVDMADEMTSFTKNNILQQASQAMLSQANQQAQGVLQLLR